MFEILQHFFNDSGRYDHVIVKEENVFARGPIYGKVSLQGRPYAFDDYDLQADAGRPDAADVFNDFVERTLGRGGDDDGNIDGRVRLTCRGRVCRRGYGVFQYGAGVPPCGEGVPGDVRVWFFSHGAGPRQVKQGLL